MKIIRLFFYHHIHNNYYARGALHKTVPTSHELRERKRKTMGVFIICHRRGRNSSPLRGVITWRRTVECVVSVSNCVIYIHLSLLSYKYDDIVVLRCVKQHF